MDESTPQQPKDRPNAAPGSPSVRALIALLCDESKSTQKAVIKALVELGGPGERALEKASVDENPRLRARARAALQEFRRGHGMESLRQLLLSAPGDEAPAEGTDLVRGLLAIDDILGFREASTHGSAPCPAEEALDAWTEELHEEAAWREGPTIAAAGALRKVLADRAGLKGPESDFHNLQHVSLSRTIVQGVGLPLTLCAIYATVARRNGLEAALLPFPGQVLLGLGPAEDRQILDPFHGGALVSLGTCLRRLTEMGAPPSPEWLYPASDRAMLIRQTRNLGAAMERHGRDRDARAFARLIGEVT